MRWRNGFVALLLMSLTISASGCSLLSQEQPKAQPVPANSTVVDKPTPEVAQQEAVKLLQQGKYAETVAKADEILQQFPDSADTYSVRGMALALEGKTDEGLKDTQKAYQLNPNSVSNYYNMAMVYKLQGNLTQAKAWFERVLQKDPRNTWSIYGMATIYADQGQDRLALQWLSQAIGIDPSVKAVARTQDHFVRFHGNPQFEAMVK